MFYCDDCISLTLTEKEQHELRDSDGFFTKHSCLEYPGIILRHNGHRPNLPRPKTCNRFNINPQAKKRKIKMKTYNIKSSNIQSIGYGNESRILIVGFKGGGSYSYQDVPAEKVTTLLFSESTGKAFHANIKKYKFKENDVAEVEPTTIESFVIKHYSSDERPIIKGNGFDGLEIGEDREEAQKFIDFINQLVNRPTNQVDLVGQVFDCEKSNHCAEAGDISCNYRCGNYTPAT